MKLTETNTGFEMTHQFWYHGRWLSGDPAMGDYIPGAPINDEAKKRNSNLPGMGGVFNVVNLHTFHYAGNNPLKYTDPDGNKIIEYQAVFNMSDRDVLLGNSRKETIASDGCYITTFANIGFNLYSGGYEGRNYGSSRKMTALGINSLKGIFKSDIIKRGGYLNDSAMNTIFGEGRWDYFTKGGQKDKGGLLARLKELDASGTNYMIAAIFDLSSATDDVTNHMVGITGLPGENGIFDPSMIVPTSNGDRVRLEDVNQSTAYNIDNLKMFYVILVD
jgi:hypothetical protein